MALDFVDVRRRVAFQSPSHWATCLARLVWQRGRAAVRIENIHCGVENLKMRTVAEGRSLIAYTRKKKQAINFLTQDYELFARKRLIKISK
jgi:hypothetical protein